MKTTRSAAIAPIALLAALLAGCSIADSRAVSPTPLRTAHSLSVFPPIRSGGNDVAAGQKADALIALAVLPPRTSAVAKSPAPSLEKPFSSFGCGEVQRSLFWVANGWTLRSLSDWLRAHPLKSLVLTATGFSRDSDDGAIVALSVSEGQGGGLQRDSHALTMLLVRLADDTVGVRVEAEVTPQVPCKNTQTQPVVPPTQHLDPIGTTSPEAVAAATRKADALLALVTPPPGTSPVTTAPVAGLGRPFQSGGCGTVSSQVIWVGREWTMRGLAEWFRAHPIPGYSITGNGTGSIHGVVTELDLTESPDTWDGADTATLDLNILPIGHRGAGVHVEAQSSPIGAVCIYA